MSEEMKPPFPWALERSEGEPFYYPENPEGYRCAWAMVWHTSQGQVRPRDWATVEDLSETQVKLELEDVAARSEALGGKAAELLESGSIGGNRAFLKRARTNYFDQVCWWNPPARRRAVKALAYKPGWAPKDWGRAEDLSPWQTVRKIIRK